MTAVPSIEDVQSYLSDSGWRRQPRTWRQATIWSHADGYEVLVPPRDDLADASLRLQEILSVLARVEERPPGEIAGDISAPLDDIQLYRAVPEGLPDGYIPLDAGFRSLRGIRDLVAAAARIVVDRAPSPTAQTVTEVLQQVRLGPARAGSYVFTLRVPVGRANEDADDAPGRPAPLGRRVAQQLHQTIMSVHAAVSAATEGDLAPFDNATGAGVTPKLCDALSQLAGRQFQQPFDITFRWARGLPASPAAGTVSFAPGSGRLIRSGGLHLQRRSTSGVTTLTGVIESLNDEPDGNSRWRIRVRGADGERALWARLDSQESYDRAIAAHRARARVRISGQMSQQPSHNELAVADGGLEILD